MARALGNHVKVGHLCEYSYLAWIPLAGTTELRLRTSLRESMTAAKPVQRQEWDKVLGQDSGLISFMREWTTAHPKVDPISKEMLMFHSSFAPPFVQYSIVPQAPDHNTYHPSHDLHKVLNAAVPGVQSAKMMHDFGVSTQTYRDNGLAIGTGTR